MTSVIFFTVSKRNLSSRYTSVPNTGRASAEILFNLALDLVEISTSKPLRNIVWYCNSIIKIEKFLYEFSLFKKMRVTGK